MLSNSLHSLPVPKSEPCKTLGDNSCKTSGLRSYAVWMLSGAAQLLHAIGGKGVVALLLLLGAFVSRAQSPKQTSPEVPSWQIHREYTLDTLFVTERYITQQREVQAGARVQSMSPELLQVFQSRSLAELLSDHSAVHIKSMGLGALATASFRGAAAAQTRVNWNGVNITPVMSGIFDFSQMPVFFADKVSLVYGSTDVKSGSGAVGGSVHLSSVPQWDGAVETTVAAEYGSYGTYTVRGASRYGTSRSSFKSRAYYQHSDNDYEYINKVTTSEWFRERRVDAQYTMWSAMQDMHLKVGDHSILTGAAWYQQGDRMLPQPLGVESTSHERQRERNLRLLLGWDYYLSPQSQLTLKAAYIYYQMRYDKWYSNTLFDPSGNTNASHTIHGSVDYTHRFGPRLHLNSTLTYQHDIAVAESYRDLDPSKYVVDGESFAIPDLPPPVAIRRHILSWHNALRWQLATHWLIDLRAMLETNNGHRPVLTYSAGYRGSLVPRILDMRGSVSFNYRYPSLNELYWRPGGNPDLLPERGTSVDATLSLHLPLRRGWSIEADVSPYLMLIDNWILWLPIDSESGAMSGNSHNQWLWTPQNKRDVLSMGVETVARLRWKSEVASADLSFSYAYTDSHSRTRKHQDDGSLLKQIPYVPKQKWNVRLALEYQRAFLNFQTTYVGVRYITTDQSYFTYPYNVCHLQLGYTLPIGRVVLSPQLRVDNLFNTYYESTQYYPMPRRNFLGSLLVRF